jgi:IclR family KDG regulon transcriptional repressor
MPAQSSGSSSVQKAFAILDLIATRDAAGISLNDASRHLSVSKSTAHRYLQTLETLGVVERDERDCFHLGSKLIELAGIYLSDVNLIQQARPFLHELVSLTKETVHLAIPSGTEVVYVAKVDSPQTIAMRSHVGLRAPMYCTALGKAILSRDLDGRWLKEVSSDRLKARTPNTITSPESLHRELKETRQRGYAIDNQENEMGVSCVGAPILDYRKEVVGAISVSGPANRMTEERQSEVGPLVRRVALDISRRMGYPAPMNDQPQTAIARA